MKSETKLSLAKTIIVLWYSVGAFGFIIEPLRPYFQMLTSVGMFVTLVLLLSFHKPFGSRDALVFSGIAILGFVVEMIGVNTGLIFGTYEYGNTLGIKLVGTPLVIGINWLILVYCIASLLRTLYTKWYFSIVGAILLVGFDWLMEPVAVATNMWTWANSGPPLKNYLGWAITAIPMFELIKFLKIKDKNPLSGLLLFMLTFFFTVLNIYAQWVK